MNPEMGEPESARDALFIDSEIRVFEGDEARARLAGTNDARFLEGERGVVRVDRERWEEAQRYERRTWMENLRFAADDHNREYLDPFRDYAALRGRSFERAIELGCGPFTNMRLVLERADVREVHLLDPLAADYLHHPLCRYRGGRLGGLKAVLSARALPSWRAPLLLARELGNALRIGGLRGRPVHVEPVPIEEFSSPLRFDLVVMINVLEHCRDAQAVFSKIDEILLPGGLVVFHDRLWDEGELGRTIGTLYDAGHPLRVGRAAAEPFLSRYEPLLRDERQVMDVEGGIRLRRTAVSFVGRKRS
jgi:SAM-dependent methyltransferase